MSTQPKPAGEPESSIEINMKPTGEWVEDNKREFFEATKPTGEWTVESVKQLVYQATGADLLPDVAKAICDAHNAELAAAKAGGWLSQEALDEYAKVEQEAQQLRDQLAAEREGQKHYRGLFDEIRQTLKPLTHTDATKKEIIDCVKQLTAERFKKELDAEREKRRIDLEHILDLDRTIQQLREQLAAAQAKLKNAITFLQNASDYGRISLPETVLGILESSDTTALDAAIVAARKPLVDALHKLAMLALQSQRYTDDLEYRDATDAALAKVKEGK